MFYEKSIGMTNGSTEVYIAVETLIRVAVNAKPFDTHIPLGLRTTRDLGTLEDFLRHGSLRESHA